MILNTGQRTDIPAFFPEWLANRIEEGFVLVRNPYNPSLVPRYEINPQVVDAIGFCTKNPEPFFPYMGLVKDFGQFWYLTITPYEKDIEPGVPDKSEVIEAFKHLSRVVGAEACGWVFENTKYDTIYSYMKYTNVASYSTALANGMKKVKEYPDPKNEISYAYAITRKEWEEL